MATDSPEFPKPVVKLCAERAGYHCSACHKLTIGPNFDPNKHTKSGEAAHICAKSPGGPRYDSNQTNEQRRSIDNALWLCGGCHPLIDKDFKHHPADDLWQWKADAEARARRAQFGADELTIDSPQSWRHVRWNHETTDDEYYVNRESELRQLTRWYNDSNIRCISVIGLGGAGKTAMIGHWLKASDARLERSTSGLFYWSFYAGRESAEFIDQLADFIEQTCRVELDTEKNGTLEAILRKLPSLPALAIVLDGLEVLQETVAKGQSYGAFIDTDLRELMLALASTKAPWITIATSRFPLTDLSRNPNAKTQKLTSVTPDEGAQILHLQSVFGNESDRKDISRFLDGHPLALRLFAATLPQNFRGSPRQHLHALFSEIGTGSGEKLCRLLSFYQRSINATQNAILSALSLFRSPVKNGMLTKVASDLLKDESKQPLLSVDLGKLTAIGLILKDTFESGPAYSCHPIVRDFFRDQLLEVSPQESIGAAQYLASARPDNQGLVGATRIEPLIIAIETLLDAGELGQARSLYATRLDKGLAFLELGLPKDGKRVCDAFLRFFAQGASAQTSLFSAYTELDFKHFLTGAIEFAIHLAEYTEARDLLERALKLMTGQRRSIPYRALARMSFRQGLFMETLDYAESAIQACAGSLRGDITTANAMSQLERIKAFVCMGALKEAEAELNKLKLDRTKLDSADSRALLDLSDLWVTLAQGELQRLKKVTSRLNSRANSMKNQQLKQDCLLALGQAYLALRKWREAENVATSVYTFATEQNCPYEMCRAQLIWARATEALTGVMDSDRVQRVLIMATQNDFQAVKVDALSLLRKAQHEGEEDPALHADLIGYHGLSLLTP